MWAPISRGNVRSRTTHACVAALCQGRYAHFDAPNSTTAAFHSARRASAASIRRGVAPTIIRRLTRNRHWSSAKITSSFDASRESFPIAAVRAHVRARIRGFVSSNVTGCTQSRRRWSSARWGVPRFVIGAGERSGALEKGARGAAENVFVVCE